MSKYELAVWPQSQYRFALFDNAQGLQTTKAVLAAHPGAVGAINLWYFAMVDQPAAGVKRWDHQNGGVKLRGKWAYEKYDFPGLCIDKDGYMSIGGKADAVWDYTACVQADYIKGKRTNTKAWPRNGVTYTGQRADGAWVGLVASTDNGLTSQGAVNILLAAGCVTILRWDGSWSSQGQLLPGQVVKPSQHRAVRGWLIIYPRDTNQKEEDKPVGKYKVCLDPGHGVETAGKRNPDGTYLEHEFNLDMANRVKAILERHGIGITMTRSTSKDVSLEQRVKTANGIAGLNLFVSLHSNASGDGWTAPDGYGIYTSMAGATAGRNIAANKLLARAKEAGIKLWGNGLFHDGLYVLKNTVAPAILVEHGFHTNMAEVELLKSSAYRDKLAEVDAKGILDYLGVPWQDEQTAPAPWYDKTQKWAVGAGISDGTRPEDNVTRAEVWAMLQRLAER